MSYLSDDAPHSEPRGFYRDERFLLTHVDWCPSGFCAQHETGVRSVVGEVVQDDFKLIQHGWHDFAAAERVILAGLRKGWNVDRICNLIRWLAPRRRVKARLA